MKILLKKIVLYSRNRSALATFFTQIFDASLKYNCELRETQVDLCSYIGDGLVIVILDWNEKCYDQTKDFTRFEFQVESVQELTNIKMKGEFYYYKEEKDKQKIEMIVDRNKHYMDIIDPDGREWRFFVPLLPALFQSNQGKKEDYVR